MSVGAKGVYGFNTQSRTYRPPEWRYVEPVDFDDVLELLCLRGGSIRSDTTRPQYAEAFANETFLSQVEPGMLMTNETNATPEDRSGNVRTFLNILASISDELTDECFEKARSYACSWMAPRAIEVPLEENVTHPLTGLDREYFRQPICISTCQSFFRECPIMTQALSVFNLPPYCEAYTYLDFKFGARWSKKNRFLRFNERYEMSARPVSTNLTQDYIDLDNRDDDDYTGWGESDTIYDDATRRDAVQDDLAQTILFDAAVLDNNTELLDKEALAASAAGFRYGTEADAYYMVRSVDGRRHALPCVPIERMEAPVDAASILCDAQGLTPGENNVCELSCPLLIMPEEDSARLQDVRVATGATTIICALAVLFRLFFYNVRHKRLRTQQQQNKPQSHSQALQNDNVRVFRPLLPPFPARLAIPLALSFFILGFSFVLQPSPCTEGNLSNTGSNDDLCAAQAFFLVTGAISTVSWWCAFAMCLALMVSDNKRFMFLLRRHRNSGRQHSLAKKFEYVIHAICWLPAIICGIIPLAADKVRWNPGASMCSIDTIDGVGWMAGALITPLILFVGVGTVAVVSTIVSVCRASPSTARGTTSHNASTSNARRGSTGAPSHVGSDTQRTTTSVGGATGATPAATSKPGSSALLLVVRFAFFVPCFLVAAILMFSLEFRRLGVQSKLNDAVKGTSACLFELYKVDDDTSNYVDFQGVTAEDRNQCVVDALLNADTGVSYGFEVAGLVAWLVAALLTALVFALPQGCFQRCAARIPLPRLRKRFGTSGTGLSSTSRSGVSDIPEERNTGVEMSTAGGA
ncbi:MAG: hypothetical protein MHM6MM_003212 [Cercozoa sp. M6MM]